MLSSRGKFNNIIRFFTILFCFILLQAVRVYSAELIIHDSSGIKGEYTSIRFSIEKIVEPGIFIEGKILLSNPTMFMPELFVSGSGCTVSSQKIERIVYENVPGVNDSLYNFSLYIDIEDLRTECEFFLSGECLAGSDTICEIKLFELSIEDVVLSNRSISLKTFNISPIDNYVRFIRINNVFPNPVNTGQTFNCDYFIDLDSDIKIFLCQVEGKIELISKQKNVKKGINRFEYKIPQQMPAGLYYLILDSNTGRAYKKFMVIK